MPSKRKPEVSIAVLGHGVFDKAGESISPEELDAISRAFQAAAGYLRAGKHGAIECDDNLASIGIDTGAPYNKTGLPVLVTVRIPRRVPKKWQI